MNSMRIAPWLRKHTKTLYPSLFQSSVQPLQARVDPIHLLNAAPTVIHSWETSVRTSECFHCSQSDRLGTVETLTPRNRHLILHTKSTCRNSDV